MLSVASKLIFIMLSVGILNVVMLSVTMMNVIMLSVAMLNVVGPLWNASYHFCGKTEILKKPSHPKF